jgi:hypothetical protein
MNGCESLAFIYCLTAVDEAEVEAAKEEQLVFPANEPWKVADTVQAREEWYKKEARRYDRFQRVVRVTILTEPEGCRSLHSPDEHQLLIDTWGLLEGLGCGVYRQAAGWQIQQRIWPVLINRSIVNNVPVPPWARHDLTRRFSASNLHDISQIYMAGASPYGRPLPPINYALQFWLGEVFKHEIDLQVAASENPQSQELHDATCQYVDGLYRVVTRYIA